MMSKKRLKLPADWRDETVQSGFWLVHRQGETRVGKSDPDAVAVGFAEFWQCYPKQYGAEAAYRKTLEGGATVEQINAAAKRYAATQIDQLEKFITYPKRWLEEGRYLDAVGGRPTIDQHGNPTANQQFDLPDFVASILARYPNNGGSWQ